LTVALTQMQQVLAASADLFVALWLQAHDATMSQAIVHCYAGVDVCFWNGFIASLTYILLSVI